jgi:hypothetical protein
VSKRLLPSADRVRELVSYNAETGVFTRLVALSPKVKVGDVAGSKDDMGYIRITLDGCRVRAHQLAWVWMTGEWPTLDIDHIDGERSNNRWHNLRHVSRSVNLQNRRAANPVNRSSGLIGASWSKAAKKWWAHIRVNGSVRYLGLFETAEAAHAAYVSAKRVLHHGNTL